MSRVAEYEDPYEENAHMARPFLTSLLFDDSNKLRKNVLYSVVDSRTAVVRRKESVQHQEPLGAAFVPRVALVSRDVNEQNDVDDTNGECWKASTPLDVSKPVDVPMERPDNAVDVQPKVVSLPEVVMPPSVDFSSRLSELEQRLEEQLEIHRQLNSALTTLDTVQRGVRNASTEEMLAASMARECQRRMDRITTGAGCWHEPQRHHNQQSATPSDVVASAAGPSAASFTAPSTVVLPSQATTQRVVQGVTATNARRAEPTGSASAKLRVDIVRPQSIEAQTYSRKIVRPKAGFNTDANLTKQVSIADAAPTVTHFDRDSPAASTARKSLVPAGDSRSSWQQRRVPAQHGTADSVRVSSSYEDGSPFPQSTTNASSVVHSTAVHSSLADTISSGLVRSEDSSSLTGSVVRVSYVDRNLASARRSVTSVSTSFDDAGVPMVISDSGSSESSSDPKSAWRSISSRSSLSRPSAEPPNRGGLPQDLFDLFHRLCQRATVVLGVDAATSQADQDLPTFPPAYGLRNAQSAGDRDRRIAPLHRPPTDESPLEDAYDVLRLRHFINVMKKDVVNLEKLRKARIAKEKLLLKAKRIAAARQRMKFDKRASLRDVEDEFDVALSPSAARRRDSDIEDAFAMSPSGYVDDGLVDDGDFVDDMAMDDGIEDMVGDEEFLDDGVVDEFDDEIGDDLAEVDDDALVEELIPDGEGVGDEEEELAEYLVEHDAAELLKSPPKHQLRSVRYERKEKPGSSVARRSGSPQHSGGSESSRPSSRHSSFYSSVEDEAETAEAERRLAMQQMQLRRGSVHRVTTTIDVEEDDNLKRHSDESGSSRSSRQSIRSELPSSNVSTSRSRDRGRVEDAFGEVQTATDARSGSDGATAMRRMQSNRHLEGKSKSSYALRDPSSRPQGTRISASAPPSVLSSVESLVSSNDADIASSLHPFSTPYTTTTSADSGSDGALPLPLRKDALFAETLMQARAGGSEARLLDREAWMKTEKRRRKALRSIAPLPSFGYLYDPCESSPTSASTVRTSAPSSSDKETRNKQQTGVRLLQQPPKLSLLEEGADGLATVPDANEAPSTTATTLSVTVSPMSLAASPALAQRRASAGQAAITTVMPQPTIQERVQMLLPTAELAAILEQQQQSTNTTNRYAHAVRAAASDDSDDSESQHTPSGADDTPPRRDGATPPPVSQLALDHPVIIPSEIRYDSHGSTPLMSLDATVAGSSSAWHQSHRHQPQLSLSMGGFDDVRLSTGNLPSGVDGGLQPAVVVDGDSVPSHYPPQYSEDDFVAQHEWKARQLELLSALSRPTGTISSTFITRQPKSGEDHAVQSSSDGDPKPPTATATQQVEGGETATLEEEEERWSREAAVHWGTLEALLHSRFGGGPRSQKEDSDDSSFATSSSYTSTDDDESYHDDSKSSSAASAGDDSGTETPPRCEPR